MRPFAPPVKTAVAFLAGLATLVGLLNCFAINPISNHPSLSSPGQPSLTTQKKPITDFIRRDQQMSDCWALLLAKTGYQPGPGTQTTQTILSVGQKHQQTQKWVSSKNSLVLPAVAGPAKARSILIQLGSAWKGLAESFGLLVTEECWGYSDCRLWVKLAGVDFVQLSGAKILPIQPGAREITIIQPFNPPDNGKLPLTGWLPLAKPRIPYLIPPEFQKIERKQITATTGQSKAAIIIDDVGYRKEAADELLNIPAQLTWAILPFAPYSEVYREAAKVRGFEIILHLPLEPIDQRWNPGPGVIMRDWAINQILAQFNADLTAVPDAVGINNHMGSAGTQDRRLMGILMREMKQRQLFFVDSMTNPYSVAEKYAGVHQVPFARRQVFIDNEPDMEPQTAALRKLIKLALQEGTVIGIAHARPGIARAIASMLPEFEKAGVEIVPVSELVK